MAISPFTVKIDGLRELETALKATAPELQKEMLKEFRVIATEVRDEARAEVPKRTGNAARSIRVSVTTSTRGSGGVAIRAGAPNGSDQRKAPYYPWLDFGGRLLREGKRRNTQYREAIKGGRYLYPAIERLYASNQARYEEAFSRVKARLGL